MVKVFLLYEKGNSQKLEYELNREEPLHLAVSVACSKLNVPGDYFSYTFQVDSTKQYLEDGDLLRPDFVISPGCTLILKLKPSIAVNSIVQSLQDMNPSIKKKAVFEMKSLLKDYSIAKEFVDLNGTQYLITFISESSGNTLSLGLTVLQEILSHGFAIPDLSDDFIQKLVSYIDLPINICRSALGILVVICRSPVYGFKTLDRFLRLQNPPYFILVKLLENADLKIQLFVLNLMNELLKKSESQFNNLLQIFDSLNINSYLRKTLNISDPEFRTALYTYQRLRLSLIKSRKETPFTKENPEDEAKVVRLWQLTLDTEFERVSAKWKEMGFQGTDPATDFRGMGMLGLENLIYFAENYNEQWKKILAIQHERAGKDYPVAVAGINITSMLFELFFSKTEIEKESIFNIFFDHEHAFEEIYSTALKILDSTWIEMDASYMDFPKVIAAVKTKLSEAISSNPSSLEQFNRAATWKGTKQPMKTVETIAIEVEDVRALRSQIRAETTKLVKQQKLSYLMDGAWFKEHKPKNKQHSYLYCKLSENQKELTYGLVSDNQLVPTELTTAKVNEFSDVVTGVNIPLFSKQKGKKLSPQDEEQIALAFSLVYAGQESKSLDFIAQTKDDFVNWTDGFRALLADKVENKETLEEINQLENIQLRVHLLDLDGIEIPLQVPEIPPLPTNYNFVS